jgi:hypothetical protein
MTIKRIFATAEKFVVDNSPGILTGLGVAGTITTAILAGKAGYSTALLLQTDWAKAGEQPTRKQEIKMVWKEFIPTAISGVATITCIVAANHIGSRRTAAIAAAFKLSEQLTEEYKERVIKTLGAQKEEKMRSELAGDRMSRAGGAETIIITGSEVVFYDELSGRFFKNEMEKVRKAVNDINHQVNNNYYASLTDFYNLIGLNPTTFSDEVGWNSDELLDVTYSTTLLQDGRPAISMSINATPIRGFDRCQ